MRKLMKIFSIGLLTCSLAACSCKNNTVEVKTQLNNSSALYNKGQTAGSLTTQDIYEYIRENSADSANKVFLTSLMDYLLDFENNEDNRKTYDLKIKKHFEETYLNSNEYMINGEFNEDLLASTLESKMYIIDRENKPTKGVTVELGLQYDYSDYISRALNYDIYMEILKSDYILTEKKDLLDNSRTRIISIYSSDDLEETETLVEEMFQGKYSSLKELADGKKQKEIEELGRQYCVNLGYENIYYEGSCSASTSSSTYDSALYKFTVCENGMRCEPKKGLEYQVGLVEKKDYVTEQIVNKNTTGILYPEALGQLFRSNVSKYLKPVIEGEDPFLTDWLYNYNKEFSNRNIILTTGPNSTNYLVTVRIVDSKSTSLEDKERALSMLLDKVSDTSVLLYYLEKVDVEINDPEIKEYYNNLLGIQ